MCGIVGYVSNVRRDASRAVASLQHRGPDDEGVFERTVSGRHLFLGHRRLRVLDLSQAAAQPIVSFDKQSILIYNGEVYNYEALRRDHLKGIPHRSHSDSEVLVNLHRQMGKSFVPLLNGDFAFAAFDPVGEKLLLARDRFGVKPLYVYHRDGLFAFASEIKALLHLDPLEAGRIDSDQIRRYFAYKYIPGNATPFASIRRLAPGHTLEYDIASDTATESAYWVLPETTTNLSYDDAQTRLRELLGAAIEDRLISDVPVGCFTSGGLDSSIIAWHLRDRKDVVHFCARKTADDLAKEGSTDDYHYARILADELQLDLEAVDIGGAQVSLPQIRKLAHYSDDLIADGSHIPTYLIAQQAKARCTVLLSGMGADEIFYGYASHQLVRFAHLVDTLPGGLQAFVRRRFDALHPGSGRFRPYKRYLKKWAAYQAAGSLRFGAYSLVGDLNSACEVSGLDRDAVADHMEPYFGDGVDPLSGMQRFMLDHFLVKNLHYVDRMSMASGVEARVPFLDHRVVEFATSLPHSYKLGAMGRTKRVLKDAYHERLPAGITTRRKAGFGMPLRSILSDRSTVDRLLNVDALADRGFIRPDAARRLITQHVDGESDQSALLYAMITLQEWLAAMAALSA